MHLAAKVTKNNIGRRFRWNRFTTTEDIIVEVLSSAVSKNYSMRTKDSRR